VTAVVLAGGEVFASAQLRRLAGDASLVIAADSGLRHARVLSLTPQLIVGDFDSLSPGDLQAFPGVPQERHPVIKDRLDLELAIEAALARGSDEIRVIGAIGSRFDQSLAALLIAARFRRDGTSISLHTGRIDAYPLRGGDELLLDLPPGMVFSLLGLALSSTVSLSGARYPLDYAGLPFGVGLGLSNAASAPQTRVRLHSGLIAVVVERLERESYGHREKELE